MQVIPKVPQVMSWIGNGVHFSVLIVASRGKRHSALSDIKPWTAQECGGFDVLLPVTAGGIAEAAQAGAVFAFRQLRICQGLWKGWQKQLQQPQRDSFYLTWFETTLDSGDLLHPLHWACCCPPAMLLSPVLWCSACRAGTSPRISPHCVLLRWLWCTASSRTSLPGCGCVLWQGYLSPGQMPTCFYWWKVQWSILTRSTGWLCILYTSAVKALD